MSQLTLPVTPRGDATFAIFDATANRSAVKLLRDADEGMVYLWGPGGSGKTHLLHAQCNEASALGQRALSLDLGQAGTLHPDVLQGLEALDWVCLDNLHAIVGQRQWETALFDLCNRVRETDTRLRVCALGAPNTIGLMLPDLVSRLQWGPVFALACLDDAGKERALDLHARSRQLPLPAEVRRYLLRHGSRDMSELLAMLQRLDQDSLSHHRPLTVPFVKQRLGI